MKQKIKDIDSELKKFKQALLKVHINKRPSAYHICIAKMMREQGIKNRENFKRKFKEATEIGAHHFL